MKVIYLGVIFIIVLMILILNDSNKNVEHLQFNNVEMKKAYLKQGIIYDKKNKQLRKCNNNNCKTINISSQLNHPNSNHISNNKIVTSRILALNNISVPKSVLIRKKNFSKSYLNFLIQNEGLKYPLVLKPVSGTQGYGVHLNINNIDEVYDIATKLLSNNRYLTLEEQVYGDNYRIMVLNNEIVDIAKRPLPYVVGNNNKKLETLIKEYNIKQKLDGNYPCHNINENYIKTQGYNLNSNIPNNKTIYITNVANYHNGSNTIRIPMSKVHQDNINMFKKTNKLLGLELSGIDYMTNDISKSYKQEGYIIEVNSGPDVTLHIAANKSNKSMIPDKIVSLLNKKFV